MTDFTSMTDFLSQKLTYDITMDSFPGIYFIFLNAEKDGETYQRVAFFEAKEDAWFECQNFFDKLENSLNENQCSKIRDDIATFPPENFVIKVLDSSPEYYDDEKRQSALNKLRDEFFDTFRSCQEY